MSAPLSYEAIAPLVASSTDDTSGVVVLSAAPRPGRRSGRTASLFAGRSLDTELQRRAPGCVDLEEATAGATRETLATIARRHVVDEAIVHMSASGLGEDDVRQRIEELGEQIGLGADEAARTLIRWTKRQG